jgi:hypothetical protein
MILSSLPAHNVGRKTLISHGSTDRGQASPATNATERGLGEAALSLTANTATREANYLSRIHCELGGRVSGINQPLKLRRG